MGITVIDQAPEIFWFVSQALLSEEYSLKHIPSSISAEASMVSELTPIVILNGDDETLNAINFIGKMRNHVFLRDSLFIVFTANMEADFKRKLLIAGAAQVLYRGKGFTPSPKFLLENLKWFSNLDSPPSEIFNQPQTAIEALGKFTTYGRIGFVSKTSILIESNLDLNIGDGIQFQAPLIDDELNLKNYAVKTIKKNEVGRYYQYANSLELQFLNLNENNEKKIHNWIVNNGQLTKQKPIKLVYIESNANYREEVRQLVRFDSRYTARGYGNSKEITKKLSYHMPQLVLINRDMINASPGFMEELRKYLSSHYCFAITYSLHSEEAQTFANYKTKYPFAMHIVGKLEKELLESMIVKLEEKLPAELKPNPDKVYLSKTSPLSRINFTGEVTIKSISLNGVTIEAPIGFSNYCALELKSTLFSEIKLSSYQYFRVLSSKPNSQKTAFTHRLIFIGQTISDHTILKHAIHKINEQGSL